MDSPILPNNIVQRIKDIHALSKTYNDSLGNNHTSRLLELIKEHSEEIETLFRQNNAHFLTETGDLIMLCFEVLLENNVPIDDMLLKCFKRYETKLPKLIKELSA